MAILRHAGCGAATGWQQTGNSAAQRVLARRARREALSASPTARRLRGRAGGWRTRGSRERPSVRTEGSAVADIGRQFGPLLGADSMEGTDEPTVRSGPSLLYWHRFEVVALQPVVHVRVAFGMPASCPRVRSRLDRRPDDVRVEDLRHQFQPAHTPAIVVEPCHGLHVLLRHGLLRHAPGFEGIGEHRPAAPSLALKANGGDHHVVGLLHSLQAPSEGAQLVPHRQDRCSPPSHSIVAAVDGLNPR